MRLLTAVAIIVICGFAAVRGWSIAHFAEARALFASNEGEVDGVGRWVGVPGLTGMALKTSLAQTADVSDVDGARKRAESLAALLSVRPLSSENWLSLAKMRLVTSQPDKEVIAAWLMSSVTGPNERTVMWQRGVFGLLLWQALPPDARRRTIGDLAGAIQGQGTSVVNGEISVAK